MFVSSDNFHEFLPNFLSEVETNKVFFLDTETTGLQWYKGAMPFSIILSGLTGQIYYLNLMRQYVDSEKPTLSRENLAELQARLFCRTDVRMVAHNAKFDWHMLANIGLDIQCQVYDTMVMERLIQNNRLRYDLGSLTGQKSDAARDFIKKNPKLCKIARPDGSYDYAFWRIPSNVITEYAMQDVEALRGLYTRQIQTLSSAYPEGCDAFAIELDATRTIWEAERRGIRVDMEFIRAATIESERDEAIHMANYRGLTGEEFVSSSPRIAAHLLRIGGIELPQTGKGNPSATEDILSKIDHPLAATVLAIRKQQKIRSTYLDNFSELRDAHDIIHCDFRQTGADTLRMSASCPNLQNVSTQEDEAPKYPLRGCFIARDGFNLLSIDFAAQEMRCIIDAAGEAELAARIMAGEDVHDATAAMMGGIQRKKAKNIGFGIIYGMGLEKLGGSLKTAVVEAKRLRDLYFSRLPRVKAVSTALTRSADQNGYVCTRYGNILWIEKDFGYKGTNYFVQGSCAQHTKAAGNAVRKFLLPYKSRILLFVHDELVIELAKDEHHLIPQIRKLMEDAFPHIMLPMGTSAEIYKERWGGETMS